MDRHFFVPYKKTTYCGWPLDYGARCGLAQSADIHLSDDIVGDRRVPFTAPSVADGGQGEADPAEQPEWSTDAAILEALVYERHSEHHRQFQRETCPAWPCDLVRANAARDRALSTTPASAPDTITSEQAQRVVMGFARIKSTNGKTHDVVFRCAACGRKLIWSFEDWKCPCGNSSFQIDTAVEAECKGEDEQK